MKAKDSLLYTSADAYLHGPDGMNNEVTMWAVAAGILMKESVRMQDMKGFGGLHASKGLERRLALPHLSLLDACCGPGNFANYISLVYPSLSVTGVDINPIFIEVAQKRFQKDGWGFFCHDMCTLSFSERYDFVLASSAYHHIPDLYKQRFMCVLKNHLRPSGKVLVCENLLPNYTNDIERVFAIETYYSNLRDYYAQGNATPEACEAINEVYLLEVACEEEHKVDFALFNTHVRGAGLEIELDIPVWQPLEFKESNAGSHVFLLR
ncbi:MAG: class I SAM-dependent methyltransferase [Nanoarchaeota archaeon]